jgi:hypothetical protein
MRAVNCEFLLFGALFSTLGWLVPLAPANEFC